MAMNEGHSVALECGKTVDELSDYLAAGRLPYDPDIETCPECLNALDALERVGMLSRSLLEREARELPPPPANWFDRIMDVVRSEMRVGRSLPVQHPDPRVQITLTEGAVRALVRSVGDEIDGLYIGRVDIDGDAEVPGAPVEVNITGTIAWDQSVLDATALLRTAVYDALAQHTDLNVVAVNVTIEDVHDFANGEDES
jgi:hypothetical protein